MPFVDTGEFRLHYQDTGWPSQTGLGRETIIGEMSAMKPGRTSGPPTGSAGSPPNEFEGATQELHNQETLPSAKVSADNKSGLPPLIFMHGFTLDHRMWRSQAAFFGKTHRVLTLDAMGHGKSDAPETGYCRADRVEHLRSFVDALGIDRFHLAGLSMGGTTAIGFALKYQHRLASLTLVSSAAAGWDASNKVSLVDRLAREKGLERARRKWKDITLLFYKKDHHDIKRLMEQMIDDHSGAIWMDPMRGRYPRANDLPNIHKITIPTAIFVGELDRVFVPLAEQMHKSISGSVLHVYEKAGHMLNMEVPGRFNRDLADFLTRVL